MNLYPLKFKLYIHVPHKYILRKSICFIKLAVRRQIASHFKSWRSMSICSSNAFFFSKILIWHIWIVSHIFIYVTCIYEYLIWIIITWYWRITCICVDCCEFAVALSHASFSLCRWECTNLSNHRKCNHGN